MEEIDIVNFTRARSNLVGGEIAFSGVFVLLKPFRWIGLPLLGLLSIFAAVAILRSSPILGLAEPAHVADSDAAVSAPLLSLLGARQWLNTPPLQPDALRG